MLEEEAGRASKPLIRLNPAGSGRGVKRVHNALHELNVLVAKQLAEKRQYEAATIMMRRAIAIEPRIYELWSNLSNYLWNQQKYDEALVVVNKALEINPDHAVSVCNRALIYEGLHRWEEAEADFDRAMALDPDNREIPWDRSLLYLGRGDYARGFKEYDSRLRRHKQVYPEAMPWPFWKGEDLTGKNIFVQSEQGIGDSIIFSRFFPLLKERGANRIYFNTTENLVGLLYDFREAGVEFIPQGILLSALDCDYAVFAGSLPALLDITLETLPPDPGYINKRVEAQLALGPKFVSGTGVPHFPEMQRPQSPIPVPLTIAIAWSGNPLMDRNNERSIPLAQMLRLTENPAAWLYSVQMGQHAIQDIYRLGAQHILCDLSNQLEFFGLPGTGTVLKRVDLVITCCTSIAHLAGALGVPTWVLLCRDPYWIWGTENDSTPWYPSVRLFRQSKERAWEDVMDRVQVALAELIERRDAQAA
jgi:tetratricopeptide (TPR) repeat protein